MPSLFQYPDGNSLSSTALTDNEVETAFQYIACQLLGILTDPMQVELTLQQNSSIVVPASLWLLYEGESVNGPNIPQGAFISGVGPGDQIILNTNALATGTSLATIADPNAFEKVRIGWARQGQPGPSIDSDTVFIRCVPMDTPYSRLRDNQTVQSSSPSGVQQVDVFTRSWKSEWTFYGPNSLNNAKAIQSGLIKVFFATSYLASQNLYINPSIEEPQRVPENFQGQWWERMDMVIEFNEQITETLTIGSVESVEVEIYNETGKVADFTVES